MFDNAGDEAKLSPTFSRRAALIGAAQISALTLLAARFFNLQVLETERYQPLAENNRLDIRIVPPVRGRILDRRGRVLAGNEQTFRATLTPALAGDVEAALGAFRKIVAIDDAAIETLLKSIKKQRRTVAAVIAEDLSFDDVARIGALAPELPGIATDSVWKRRYLEASPVGNLVGYIGSLERPAIDDDAVRRLPDTRIGKAGIEAGFETSLRGTGGVEKSEVDSRGRVVREIEKSAPVAGLDVHVTIDCDLQAQVNARLQSERRASVVVIEIATGAIRVLASAPRYDPAPFAERMTVQSWQALRDAADAPLFNRAVAGQYPPGSTFKMVTALAALRAGKVTLDEVIACDGRHDVAGQSYRCWARDGHGPMTLHSALKQSCDLYFFELAGRLGIRALATAAREFGLGQTFALGLPEQASGLVPDPDWKRARFGAGWLTGETILMGIGQGFVLATPLQLAVMTARLAGGAAIVPILGRSDAAPPAPQRAFAPLAFDARHLQAVRDAMVAAVHEDGGTGTRAALDAGQPRIGGKTGTSQISTASSDKSSDEIAWAERDHALFVAFVPADAPRFAVSTVIEHGGSGGTSAAPLARDVIALVLADTADAAKG